MVPIFQKYFFKWVVKLKIRGPTSYLILTLHTQSINKNITISKVFPYCDQFVSSLLL